MRNFLITLCLITFVVFNISAQQRTVVAGKIDNPTNFVTNLNIEDASLNSKKRHYGCLMDENNEFHVAFDLSEPVEAYIKHQYSMAKVYIEPGDSLYITGDNNSFLETLKYTGTKTSVANNTFIHYFEMDMGDLAINAPMIEIKNRDAKQFLAYSENLRAKKWTYFKQSSLRKKMSKSYKKFFKKEIEYLMGEDLAEFNRMNPILNDSNDPVVLTPAFIARLNKIKYNKKPMMYSSAYRNFINSMINYKMRGELNRESNSNNEINIFKKKIEMSQKYLKGLPQQYIIAKTFIDASQRGRLNHLTNDVNAFLDSNPPKEYKELIEETYRVVAGLRPGSMAPSFELESLTGEVISLDEFKGKVVYLDFWATWCGPCRKELEPARKLKKHFSGKDVVFLYITLDTDYDQWTEYVKAKDMQGIHLFANGAFNTSVAKNYNVTGIPAYFIIDKEGKMVSTSPKRPSEQGVIEEIEAALYLK